MLIKEIGDSTNLVFENDSGVILKKNDSSEIKQELIINENIEAPISIGQQLGCMNYYINDNLVASVNLVSDTEISKRNLLNTFTYVINNWFNLFRI